VSYDGSGTFNINTTGQPVVTGTTISSTAFNALTADLATGLSTAMTKDGQTTPTANIPMGNNKITGLAAGTASTDAANFGQLQTFGVPGYATTATAAGATTLTVADKINQFFTGTTTQTVVLPVTSTLVLGFQFRIVNESTGLVTVNSSGANLVVALTANSQATLTCIAITGTDAASWDVKYTGITSVTGTGAMVRATSPALVTPSLGAALATSVNKVAITAPATGATLTISDGATLTITSSTSIGAGQYTGTSTNDSAAAGLLGEYVVSTIASGSAVSLTNNTDANVTSISLTAGDWDVRGLVTFTGGGTTNVTGALIGGINTTSATLPTPGPGYSNVFALSTGTFASDGAITAQIVPMRLSLNATTTVYLIARAVFTTSTCSAYGSISARRVR